MKKNIDPKKSVINNLISTSIGKIIISIVLFILSKDIIISYKQISTVVFIFAILILMWVPISIYSSYKIHFKDEDKYTSNNKWIVFEKFFECLICLIVSIVTLYFGIKLYRIGNIEYLKLISVGFVTFISIPLIIINTYKKYFRKYK